MKKEIYIGFDLDETLISSKDLGISNEPYIDCDFNIFANGKYKYSVYERPNARLLLNYIDQNFNLFFYTRSGEDYAKSIVKNLGFEECPTFFSSSVDKIRIDTIYEGIKKFEVKRLDKIATKLNINLNSLIFFDDIKNSREIRPYDRVIKVPEYHGSDFDNALGKIYKIIKDNINLENKDFIDKLLMIEENSLLEEVDIKNFKIKNKKIEP